MRRKRLVALLGGTLLVVSMTGCDAREYCRFLAAFLRYGVGSTSDNLDSVCPEEGSSVVSSSSPSDYSPDQALLALLAALAAQSSSSSESGPSMPSGLSGPSMPPGLSGPYMPPGLPGPVAPPRGPIRP